MLSSFILLAFAFASPVLAHHQPGIQEIYVPFSELSERQKELLATLQQSRHFEGSPEQFWEKLGEVNSVQRTFFYTTEALERRRMKDGRTVLDQVKAIDDVFGAIDGARSAEQFNIQLRWKAPPPPMKSNKELFDTPAWTDRFSSDHPGEFGIQEKSKGYRGLHLLFSKDSDHGHVHVDFRGTNWFEAMMTKIHLKFLVPKRLVKGHFDARNADIGAVGPETEGGVPISNLDWFVKTYDDPRVLAYAEPSVNGGMEKRMAIGTRVTGEMPLEPARVEPAL